MIMEEKTTKKLCIATEKQFLIFINELETNLNFFEQHIVWNSKELWEPVVEKMNNEDGPKRSLDEWRTYLKRWKFGIRRKFRSVDSSVPGAMNIFTPVQQKLLLALGQLDVNICRGCFENNKNDITFILYPLFEELNDEMILSEKGNIYSKFIDAEIVQSDLLPHWLCNKCWDRCEEWTEFQKQCKQCDHEIDPTSENHNNDDEEKKVPMTRKRTAAAAAAAVSTKEKKKKVVKISAPPDNKEDLKIENIEVKQELQDLSKISNETTKSNEILTTSNKNDETIGDPLEVIFVKEEITTTIYENENVCYEEPHLQVILKLDTENEIKINKNDCDTAMKIMFPSSENQTSYVTEIKEEIDDFEIDDHAYGFDVQYNDYHDNDSDSDEELNKNNTNLLVSKSSAEPEKTVKPLKLKIETNKETKKPTSPPISVKKTENNKPKKKRTRKVEKTNTDKKIEKTKTDKKIESTKTDKKIEKIVNQQNTEIEKKFECDNCGRTFQQKFNIVRHLLQHCKPEMRRRFKRTYECFECKRKCSGPSTLKAHLVIHDKDLGIYTCHICGKHFKTPYRLRRHQVRHDPNSRMACLECGKIYATPTDLASHKKIHLISGKRHLPYVQFNPYKCHLCTKSFVKIAQLIIHGEIHTDAAKIKCDFCEKTFIYEQILARHRKIHLFPSDNPELDEEKYLNEEDPAVCELCNKTYKSRRNLRDHIYTCHRNLEKKYLCAECGKSFLKPHLLKTHVSQAHSDVADFSCLDCLKPFKSARRLRVHRRIHDPEAAKFACSECDKRFLTPSLLQCHFRKHSGERPYVCPICNKSFKARNHLKTHNRVHTGVRPFSCDICYMTFTYSDVLKRHRLKHTNNVM